jgi:hypothetical protein
MKWILYRFEGWSMDMTTREFVAQFDSFAAGFEAQSRFMDANPDVPNSLCTDCED